MKIVGLIAEYNPFHNGHLYHIERAKEITGADSAIVVMSGNYVQRGAPAIMPKHLRAEVALEAGADIIFELPVCYACASAEYFAAGAVSLFEQLNCVDSVCFGSECGDYGLLERIARVAADEPEEYRTLLSEDLKKGMSFPRARQAALTEYLRDDSLDIVLEQPNNILGIEYIKALYQKKSPIHSYTIKRMVSASHSVSMEQEGMFDEPSISEALTRLEDMVPPSCIRTLEDTHRSRYPIYANDFSLPLKYQLLKETYTSLAEYLDISEDLANRILNHTNDFVTFDQFCDLLKTRDVTYSRLSRSLLHILLGIKKKDLLTFREEGCCQYARILGFRKDAKRLLSYIKKHSDVPLITKLTQIDGLTPPGLAMLKQDVFASNLYESVITNKFKMPFVNEYQHQILKI